MTMSDLEGNYKKARTKRHKNISDNFIAISTNHACLWFHNNTKHFIKVLAKKNPLSKAKVILE